MLTLIQGYNLLEIHPWLTVSPQIELLDALLIDHSDAPQIFTAIGAGSQSLLISGFFGVVKVVSCLFFLLFLVERIGRRGSLFAGALLMGAYMLVIACLTATHPPVAGQGFTSTGAAAVTMVYLEASELHCLHLKRAASYKMANWDICSDL